MDSFGAAHKEKHRQLKEKYKDIWVH